MKAIPTKPILFISELSTDDQNKVLTHIEKFMKKKAFLMNEGAKIPIEKIPRFVDKYYALPTLLSTHIQNDISFASATKGRNVDQKSLYHAFIEDFPKEPLAKLAIYEISALLMKEAALNKAMKPFTDQPTSKEVNKRIKEWSKKYKENIIDPEIAKKEATFEENSLEHKIFCAIKNNDFVRKWDYTYNFGNEVVNRGKLLTDNKNEFYFYPFMVYKTLYGNGEPPHQEFTKQLEAEIDKIIDDYQALPGFKGRDNAQYQKIKTFFIQLQQKYFHQGSKEASKINNSIIPYSNFFIDIEKYKKNINKERIDKLPMIHFFTCWQKQKSYEKYGDYYELRFNIVKITNNLKAKYGEAFHKCLLFRHADNFSQLADNLSTREYEITTINDYDLLLQKYEQLKSDTKIIENNFIDQITKYEELCNKMQTQDKSDNLNRLIPNEIKKSDYDQLLLTIKKFIHNTKVPIEKKHTISIINFQIDNKAFEKEYKDKTGILKKQIDDTRELLLKNLEKNEKLIEEEKKTEIIKKTEPQVYQPLKSQDEVIETFPRFSTSNKKQNIKKNKYW